MSAARCAKSYRIPALAHDLADEPVGGAGRLRRGVHELRREQPPLLGVVLAGRNVERDELQPLPPQPAVLELRLGRPTATRLGDGVVVLRPELLAEPVRPLDSGEHYEHGYHHHRDDDDQYEQAGIHGCPFRSSVAWPR